MNTKKSLLISIKPKYVAKILNGEKTIEVRKTAPKEWKQFYDRTKQWIEPEPIDVYIYCTKDNKELCVYVPSANEFYAYDKNNFIAKQCEKMGLAFNGKVVAKFTLKKVEEIKVVEDNNYYENEYDYYYESESYCSEEGMMYNNGVRASLEEASCLDEEELDDYLQAKNGYAWHISNLVIFDRPKELSGFYTKHYPQFAGMVKNKTHYELKPVTRPFQSWGYVEVDE